VELRTTGEEEQNLTDKSVQLEKTIDRCCLLVSRVKYQLGSFYNYQIKQGDVDMTNLHEQFSQCGLMLEKMLTVLFQKSHLINLQVESINTVFNIFHSLLGQPIQSTSLSHCPQ
jgi:hypothetical protein